MIITTKAIVLGALKYGDSSLIVRMFTQSDGMKSYLLRGVLTSKKGKLKKGYFQPLTQLEIVASHRDKGGLESLREVKLLSSYKTLQSDVVKSSLGMFLSEMLVVCLQEEEQNEHLFEFIIQSFLWLDAHDKSANFHLSFLIELTKYLGFYPETSQQHLPFFDLREGDFVENTLNESIQGHALEVFKSLLAADYREACDLQLNRGLRGLLLDDLIRYYQYQLMAFKKPKSLEVLAAVFS